MPSTASRCTSTCTACSPSRRAAASSTSIRPAAPRCSIRAAACRRSASCSRSRRSAGTLRRLVEADATGPRPSDGRHRRRARSASIAATSRRRSAPSPSGSAGSCARPIWPATAPGSSRRCRTTFAGRGRSSASPRGPRGPSSCRPSACSRRFDLRGLGHNSARYIHVVSEALKLAFADRERYYGDREDALASIGDLLAPRYCEGARGAHPAWTARRRKRRRPAIRGAAAARRGARARSPRAYRRGRRAVGRGRRRDHAHRRDRSRRQHDLPDAERRRVPEVGVRARAGLHAQHAERDVRPGGRSPERARPGQAAARPRS